MILAFAFDCRENIIIWGFFTFQGPILIKAQLIERVGLTNESSLSYLQFFIFSYQQ